METPQTAADIAARIRKADAEELALLKRSFAADTRKTVQSALAAAQRRLESQRAEAERTLALYDFQSELSQGGIAVGLDEVGRGPLAGPLCVGAVVLPEQPVVFGLNDSKQLSRQRREQLSDDVKETAIAWTVQSIDASEIDACGMTACLRKAFCLAIEDIEEQGVHVDAVLLDGNPLHVDPRERNVVKGDAKCASIAAASIVAKVYRDALMDRYALDYPEYGFERNKGYGSAQHQQAIRQYGLTPIHRASFCTAFAQETLF